jgi:hypothetical protein
LTQPFEPGTQVEGCTFDEYILEVNKTFVELQGSVPVVLSFESDEPEDDVRLKATLEQLNGFLFTGGNLTLINRDSGEVHAYYRTAKKVIDFAIKSQDERGVSFPILAVCQGFELFGMYIHDDSKDILKDVECLFKTRKVDWAFPVAEVKKESRTFRDFDQDIIEKMAAETHVIHFHKWGFPIDDFHSSAHFTRFFKLVSTDTLESGLQYPTAYEAHKYPFYCVLYHPEYQLMLNRNDTTVAIANSFSSLLYKDALAHKEKTETDSSKALKHAYRPLPMSEGMRPGFKVMPSKQQIPVFGIERAELRRLSSNLSGLSE